MANLENNFRSDSAGGSPKKVYISTYGCQMNDHDTERMYSILENNQYLQALSAEEADVIIINSCSVREKPMHKVRSEAGKYQALKSKNPFLKIGVGGCVGQQEGEKLFQKSRVLDFVFGTDTIDSLPQILEDVYGNKKKVVKTRMGHRDPYSLQTLVRESKISVPVTITKGCDNFCSFCVVPFTRGRERSRLLHEVLEDVKSLHSRGVKEVTLLGQNVNSYKSPDDSGDFNDLIRALCVETEMQRIRYTTSHPKDFNKVLLDLHVKYRSRLGDFLHLPVQSGSNFVLERMNRGYTVEEYLEKINMIKEALPEMGISTDIIVGFPGESDEDFQKTYDLVQKVGFENIYAFKYSPRPFTKALAYKDQVPEEVKDKRLNLLLDMHKKVAVDLMPKYVDRVFDVLVEGPSKYYSGKLFGKTSHFKTVLFEGNQDLTGKIVPVKIIGGQPFALRGEQVEQ